MTDASSTADKQPASAALRPLEPAELYRRTDLGGLAFETTDELDPVGGPLGQERAEQALAVGLSVAEDGYNIFAHGPRASDMAAQVKRLLQERAAEQAPAHDWCYVNDFEDESRPCYLRLPAGRGRRLARDLDTFASDLQGALAAAFEGEDYQARRQAIEQRSQQEQEQGLESVQEKAQERGLKLVRSPMGIVFAPVKDGEVVSPEDVEDLPEEEQERIQEAVDELQDELKQVMRQEPSRRRRMGQQIRELDEEFAGMVAEDLVGELDERYRDEPAVLEHLKAIQADVTEKARELVGSEDEEEGQAQILAQQQREQVLARYKANVLVASEPDGGAPVVVENNPNHQNLIGRVEYQSRMGALTTGFGFIRAGALHRANGGYLVLDARKVLMQPYAWEALKRALSSHALALESPAQALGLVSTATLEPEPIPLDVKVILLGERDVYALLEALEPDFPQLFKVQADFAPTLAREDQTQADYARLVARLATEKGLKPLTRGAVARVLEHSARRVGDSRKLSSETRVVGDLLREADLAARRRRDGATDVDDVEAAIRARVHRADRLREELQEQTLRGTMRIATSGARVGQVNGLAVAETPELRFGRPQRITARTRLGDGEIVDIEREVALGGPLHTKGVMILSGYVKANYAPETPLSLSASLVFEQSYGEVEGDSASSAELLALLSSIAEVPLRQDLAVTGSVNQLGEVQAVGGVNEKVEGFFDLCRARGLTGEQGVVVPRANIEHLMLDRRVRDACEKGDFAVYAVDGIAESLALLTGMDVGERGADGAYPDGSVNARVEARLQRLAEARRAFASNGGAA